MKENIFTGKTKKTNRLLAAIKNSALFQMLFNPHYGDIISESDLNSEEHLQDLAIASGIPVAEMASIEETFKNANSEVEKRLSRSSSKKRDPFNRIQQPNLSSGKSTQISRTRTKSDRSQDGGREIVD